MPSSARSGPPSTSDRVAGRRAQASPDLPPGHANESLVRGETGPRARDFRSCDRCRVRPFVSRMTTAQKLAPGLARWVGLVFGGCLACASEQDPSVQPADAPAVITPGADSAGIERSTTQTTSPPRAPPSTAALVRLIRAAERQRLHAANTHYNLHGDHGPGLIRDIVRTCRSESAAPKMICRYRGCGRRCFNETIVVELTSSASGWQVSSFAADWDNRSHNCGICY